MARKGKGRKAAAADPEAGEIFEFPDIVFEGPNLDVEPPLPDVEYAEYDDQNALGLLAANGIDPAGGAVIQALDQQSGVLLAAAAHASGSLGIEEAVPRLRRLLQSGDDQAAVEAAFALVRLGEVDAAEVLRQALNRSPDAYLSTVLAANYLARLGDPAGHTVVAAGLDSEHLSTRMLSCKALHLFTPFDGRDGIDVRGLYQRALVDAEPGIRGEAIVQLRWAPPGLARPLLERYLESADDEVLRRYAVDALEHLPGG